MKLDLEGIYMAAIKNLNPARILVLGFFAVILCGALLLYLPIASKGGAEVPIMTALFTAISATTITGLVVVDTAHTWGVFGLAVILCLMQIGGLGFMSVITVFFFLMHKKIGLTQRMLMVQTMSLHDMQGVVRLIRHVMVGTVFFQSVGVLALLTRFAPMYGFWGGLGRSVFFAVSAFCNAGFDLVDRTYAASPYYFNDWVITITVISLVLIGGLGFFVWEDIWRSRRFGKFHIHTKLVLVSSLLLVVIGALFYFFAENKNPGTFGGLTRPDMLLASLFQTSMTRSGGLAMASQSSLRGVSQMMTILLMLVGGSAGSTAGGIKNVTVAILVLSAINRLRGKNLLSIFGRTIPASQILSALSIAVVVIALCFTGAVFISFTQPGLPFAGILFETASAIATCGLTQGITPLLEPPAQIVIMFLMLFGRVGIMTLGMAVFMGRGKTEKIKYPDAWVIIG